MSERGATLVELIVALALGAVILLGGSTVYRAVVRSTEVSEAQAYLQNQALIVTNELTRQIEAASIITRTNGVDSDPDTCPNGVVSTLYLAQPDGTIYCFYSSSGQFLRYRLAPGGGTSGTWNMLSGSPVPLIVTSLDLCGSPPYSTCQTTGDIAYVTFQLRAGGLLGGTTAAPTMTFSAAVAKRN